MLLQTEAFQRIMEDDFLLIHTKLERETRLFRPSPRKAAHSARRRGTKSDTGGAFTEGVPPSVGAVHATKEPERVSAGTYRIVQPFRGHFGVYTPRFTGCAGP